MPVLASGIKVCMGKIAASVVSKLLINGNETCHTTDSPSTCAEDNLNHALILLDSRRLNNIKHFASRKTFTSLIVQIFSS